MNNIYGIGIDIVNSKRIKSKIQNNKKKKKRVFSKDEILYCEKKINKISCYSKRFAAKEAFAKSLGTGISKNLSFKEIEVKKKPSNQPYIKLKGKSLIALKKMIKYKKYKIHLSLSDDMPFVIASVILITL